jgi:hypothetical protein
MMATLTRRARLLASVAVAGAAVVVASTAAPIAFVTYDGYSRTGMNVVPGATAVINVGLLRPAHPGSRIELVSATVGGAGSDGRIGHLDGVRVYQIGPQGGIGAITGNELSGIEGAPGWTLVEPAEAVITDQPQPWEAVVLVTGLTKGVWSADYVDYEYRIDGRHGTQRVPIGATVCVVTSTDEPPCEI